MYICSMIRLQRVFYQFLFLIALTLLVYGLMLATLKICTILFDIGWGFLWNIYGYIFFGLVLFYYFTSFHNKWITIGSFLINFILWVAEQVITECHFHNSPFYQKDSNYWLVFLLGGLFWGINKVVLDVIFFQFKIKMKLENKLETFLNKRFEEIQ